MRHGSSRTWKPQTGVEELVRETGTVTTPLDGGAGTSTRVMVRVHGELWQATSASPIQAGARVRVLRVEGLTLYVEPLDMPS